MLRRSLIAVLACLVAVAATVAGLGPLRPEPAAAAAATTVEDVLDLLTYRIRTVHGSVVKTTNAVVGVPALVDVDRSAVPVPDLLVEVVALPTGQAGVVISALRPDIAPRVELLFDLPGAQGVAFGYDATTSKAPTLFSTTLSFTRSATTTNVVAAVDTVGAGDDLGVVTELFTRGQGGSRQEPTVARIDFAPVPSHLGAAVASGPGSTTVSLTATSPTVATLDLFDSRAGRTRHVTGEVRQLPSALDLEILSDAVSGHVEAHYVASAPIDLVDTTVTETRTGTDVENVLALTAEDLPSTIDVVVETEGAQQAHYNASAPLGRLSVSSRQSTGDVLDNEVRAEVLGVPQRLDLIRTGAAAVALSASGPIGSIEGGLATGGGVALLDDATDYVHLLADGAHSSVAAQVLGLQSLAAGASDQSTSLTATRAAGPFRVLVDDDARTIDAVVTDLPSTTSLQITPGTGSVEYHGDSAVDLIDVEVTADQPFLARAAHADIEIRDVPTDLRLQVGPSAEPFELPEARAVCEIAEELDCEGPPPPPPGGGGGTGGTFPDTDSDTSFVFDTNGAAIGRIDVTLDDGSTVPVEPLDACEDDGTLPGPSLDLCEDGVIVEDRPAGFVLQGRLTGLRFVGIRLLTDDLRDVNGPLTDKTVVHFELDPEINAGRPVRLDLRQQAAGGVEDRVDVDVSNLPATATATIRSSKRVGGPSAVSFTYDASDSIRSIHLNADLSGMPNPFDATLTDVPTSFTLCRADDGRCHGSPAPARDAGSFRFDASSPVTLDAFLCIEPATGTCVAAAQADDFLRLRDVRLQHLTFGAHEGAFTEANPAVVSFDTEDEDTVDPDITGSIVFRIKDRLRIDLNFPGDFLIAYTGPNVVGRWTGGLSADDLTLKIFDPNGLFQVFRAVRSGSLGCDAIDFWEIPLAPFAPPIDLERAFCG